jgi:hypothetical protein
MKRIPLLIFAALVAASGCKSETKIEKAPAAEEKPVITEETQAEDADVKAEVESICSALKKCRRAGETGGQCDEKGVLKELALKSPYATGLRDRLVSSEMAKKDLDELAQNARGLGAKCDLESKSGE